MIALHLINREEMVFSSTPATAGGHEAVLNIPGSALWGATLARLYAADPKDEAAIEALWLGKVRISPAYPLTYTGCPAFPFPQTLQKPKHKKSGVAAIRESDLSRSVEDGEDKVIGWRITEKLWNTLFGSLEGKNPRTGKRERIQTEAIKGAFLAVDGSVAKPKVAERGKAAVRPGDRRVATSQFFQYEHLDASQHWLAWIDCDIDAEGEATRVADILKQRPLSLGRSKRREFGGNVTVELADAWRDPRGEQVGAGAQPGEAATKDSGLVLWCLSDLALVDDNGSPNLAPELDALGLPRTGLLDKAKSQITTRRFAPHNLYLGARDREQAVIAAGSVLVYMLRAPLSLDCFKHGLGLFRERGFGLVWPNPSMAMVERPVERRETDARMAGAISVVGTVREPRSAQIQTGSRDDRLLKAVKAHADSILLAHDVSLKAESLAEEFRKLKGRASLQGPTPSVRQWRLLERHAQNVGDLDGLHRALFDEEHGMCVGERNKEWSGMRQHLQSLVESGGGAPVLPAPEFLKALARAARQIARDMRRGR